MFEHSSSVSIWAHVLETDFYDTINCVVAFPTFVSDTNDRSRLQFASVFSGSVVVGGIAFAACAARNAFSARAGS